MLFNTPVFTTEMLGLGCGPEKRSIKWTAFLESGKLHQHQSKDYENCIRINGKKRIKTRKNFAEKQTFTT